MFYKNRFKSLRKPPDYEVERELKHITLKLTELAKQRYSGKPLPKGVDFKYLEKELTLVKIYVEAHDALAAQYEKQIANAFVDLAYARGDSNELSENVAKFITRKGL